MSRTFRHSFIALGLTVVATASTVMSAELQWAKVTQIIKDVRLLPSQAAPRPASVSDEVAHGTAVRTGVESRAELTFTDATITRLGENTVFSYVEGSRNLNLGSGAILVQVPPKAPAVQVRSAAFTCAVTGGTAMMESNPGHPSKVMVMEGKVDLCSIKYPNECQTLQRGEMLVMTADGHVGKSEKFDVKTAYKTAHLLSDFPPLPNDALILSTIDEQNQGENNPATGSPTPGTVDDIISQKDAATTPTPPSNPGGSPSKFGSPDTIPGSPYIIDGTTQIQTDPTITTGGVTSFGKIYRGVSTDGPFTTWAFGSTTAFDNDSGLNGHINDSGAVFKFNSLSLAGDPIIDTTNGEHSMALIGVISVINASGGPITFSGLTGVLIATEAGPIVLNSGVSFDVAGDISFYARGNSSDLSLGSNVTGDKVRLYAGRNITVNSQIVTDIFSAYAGDTFSTPAAPTPSPRPPAAAASFANIDASLIDIFAGSELDFNTGTFVPGDHSIDSITLTSPNTVNIDTTADTSVFAAVTGSVTVSGHTINLSGGNTIHFNNPATATFTAGTGGIQGPSVTLEGFGDGAGVPIDLSSDGDINVFSVTSQFFDGETNHDDLQGSVIAAGAINAGGDIVSGTVQADGDITLGGRLHAVSIESFNGNIMVDDGIHATGGDITAHGDIFTGGQLVIDGDPFGNITAGGDITANGGIFTPGAPEIVHADGSIRAPAVITGTLSAGQDIHIDNSTANFSFGIIANTITAGATLNLVAVPTISPNNGGSSNDDGETFDDLTITVGSISSTGPTYPVVSANGGDADTSSSTSAPGNGGNISITTTDGGLSVGDAKNLASISANGGAYNQVYDRGGSGGSVTIQAIDDVVVSIPTDENPAISATTGTISDIFSNPASGAGGQVHITTDAAISVSGEVIVSSDDISSFLAGVSGGPRESFPPTPGRESATGGSIDLQSNLTSGQGITVATGGSLLSLLGFNAFDENGEAGEITLSTMGADITVNGTVEADFGTITIDQTDPGMGTHAAAVTPQVTIDGASLISNQLNVHSLGDVNIALVNKTNLLFTDASLHAENDINWNVGQTTINESLGSLTVQGDHAINLTGGTVEEPATLRLFVNSPATFSAGTGGINAATVSIETSNDAVNFESDGDITAYSIVWTDFVAQGSVSAAGAITTTGNLFSGTVGAGTSISVGGDVSVATITAGTTLDVTGSLSATDVTADGNITVGGATRADNITSTNGSLSVANGIFPDVFTTDVMNPAQGAKAPHAITAQTIASPNGIDFSGNQFAGIKGYTSGGILTINANEIVFETDNTSAIGAVNFNGADASATDFNGATFTTGGDGGMFVVNTTQAGTFTGDITVNSPITATTGQIDPFTVNTSGAGGDVELNSDGGTVTVNQRIEVSSAEPTSTVAPFRASSSGGSIKLTSNKASGVAVNVTNSGQLLALLSAAAPGPGGTINIQATGADSKVNVSGQVYADRGTIDVRQTGTNGEINLGDTSGPPAPGISLAAASGVDMRADTIKIGALGDNGVFNIGNATVSADTVLKLYAGGSNGTVNFIADVALNGTGMKIIAGKTVNVFDGVTVTVGGSNPANVYTDNANYTGSGGNGAHTGTFGGAGATTSAFSGAPSFDNGGNANRPARIH